MFIFIIRFQVQHILSEPRAEESCDEKFLTGRVSSEMINSILSKKSSNTDSPFVCVCGPMPFVDNVKTYLNDAGFDSNNLHCFHG